MNFTYKILFIILIILQIQNAQAQVLLEANVTLNNSFGEYIEIDNEINNTTEDFFNMEIAPAVGFYLGDNVVLGVKLGFSFYNNSDNSFSGSNTEPLENISTHTGTQIVAGPFIRLNKNMSNKVTFSNQIEIYGGIVSSKGDYFSENNPVRSISDRGGFTFGTAYSPIISIDLSDKVILEFSFAQLYYQYAKTTTNHYLENENSGEKSNESEYQYNYGYFDINFNTFSLGLAFKL